MGLPSRVQWALSNIGAARPSDLGWFFSWGNIEGHSLGEGYDFSLDVYNSTPAAAINTDLSLSEDAAVANLGGSWRMPTITEFQELYDNCSHVFATLNGVNGLLFTSNVNGNTLFFPAAGEYIGTSHNNRGSGGSYWSSTWRSKAYAHYLSFSSSNVNLSGNNRRFYGLLIRAVLPPT